MHLAAPHVLLHRYLNKEFTQNKELITLTLHQKEGNSLIKCGGET